MHLYDLRKYSFITAEDITLEKISTNQFGPAALECSMIFHFYKNPDKGPDKEDKKRRKRNARGKFIRINRRNNTTHTKF